MKNKNEKKSIVKSIKLSQNQYDIIMQKAKDRNMNFSEYMVDRAVHGDSLSPQIAVRVQTIMNLTEDIADKIENTHYCESEKLREQVDAADELFHRMTPEEYREQLKREMGIVLKAGEEIWDYLK